MGLEFFKAMARNPRGMGAVGPSGNALARMMVQASGLQPGQRVVELGAGTGSVTLELMHHTGDVLALEPEADLAAVCRRRCPSVEVVEELAQDLPRVLAERGWDPVDRVVSSLPFAAWPDELQETIFDAIEASMAPGGRLVTFTYLHSPLLPAGRAAKARLERRFADLSTSPTVWWNVLPAFVYVGTRR